MDDEFDDIEWEDVYFDGDLFVDDQRRKERHGAQVKVAFSYDGEQHKAMSGDISDGGLFIATDELLPRDTEFKLVFKLPTFDEPLRAIGRVAWLREEPGEEPDEYKGFGVQFVTISDEAIARITEFIELRSALLFADDE
ncbi:hypothetical protein FIV42_02040 [Persicimonas caeni]|uniref:PilZ domain-containing protein n=1 Tax=Persicimonas caeni TaxID=2292766 RepID=A0A4Y6PMT0_PERCE|nr:PilZ domain-containing protein [Persicimonas caeni]QDG49560.1 hypothetical protein FIV42_02040 [Persicimonas caeni]QED30781.1 hypothetical protein FRD00_02035 [Persicimonas caeni]